MTSPDQPAFAAGFMDDYFAEADDHIVSVKRALLALESTVGQPVPPSVLEELFRSFHSLKGISAMVEFREAESVAHEMEGGLRAIQQGAGTLGPADFETLLDGTKALEDTIIARRVHAPLPDSGPALAALRALSTRPAASSVASGTESIRRPTEAAGGHRSPVPVWKVTFVPSPHLVARGVKVDTIRARLLQTGRVLAVAPVVLAGGGISFEFHVQTADEGALAALAGDGVSYEALREPADGPRAGDSITDAPAAAHRRWDSVAPGIANYVRVDLLRLDDLLRLVGDLVVTRARLDDSVERAERHMPAAEYRALQEHTSLLERQLRDLREGIMRVRLVPVGEIFKRMPFVVRDLARETGKRVRLDLAGQHTEIDKFLIERMMDPVLHLVRNAISHGIEAPDRRQVLGKPAEGVIRLSAATAGETVVLEISDDGAGIDVEEVAARARDGAPAGDGRTDSRAILDIICAPGFSTRREADRGSGRGVGMAVVRQTVQELGGSLSVDTQAGKGTTFTIVLPLTLAITEAIIAHAGDRIFAIPQAAVREVVEVEASAVRMIERNELIPYRGGALPVARLTNLFRLEAAPRPRLHALVVGTGRSAIGLLVDRVGGQREVVVKTITDPLIRVDGISGATELGDGRLVLIIDAAALSRRLRSRSPGPGAGVEEAVV